MVVSRIAQIRCTTEELCIWILLFAVTATYIHHSFRCFKLNFNTFVDGCQIVIMRLCTRYGGDTMIWKWIHTIRIRSWIAAPTSYGITWTKSRFETKQYRFIHTIPQRNQIKSYSMGLLMKLLATAQITFTREALYMTYITHCFTHTLKTNVKLTWL